MIAKAANCSVKRRAQRIRRFQFLLAIVGPILCFESAKAAESHRQQKPVLRVPLTDTKPVVDGRLDESCWKDAAKTGPLEAAAAQAGESTTEAFVLRDAEHLYVGVSCATEKSGKDGARPEEPSEEVESVELLLDSNGDRNSYYLIRTPNRGRGKTSCSYNELDPPWNDRTWQPPLKAATADAAGVWTAEFALPLNIFNKNKTLASETGFNVRRISTSGDETHCWHGAFANPGDAGMLTGIPALDSLPKPANLRKPPGD